MTRSITSRSVMLNVLGEASMRSTSCWAFANCRAQADNEKKQQGEEEERRKRKRRRGERGEEKVHMKPQKETGNRKKKSAKKITSREETSCVIEIGVKAA